LQKLLGFENYLLWFSKFKIATLKWDDKENHFLYFLELLPNNGIVLDIGANIGIMASWLAKKKPEAKIFCYEPIKENYDVLTKIIQGKKYINVVLHNIALGAVKGQLKMIMPIIGSAKQQGLSHVYNATEHYDYDGEKYTVDVEKIDDLFIDEKEHITGIKIDVENFEYQVLLGAQETLKKHKPLLYVELWDNQNRSDCFTLMKSLGYEIMVLNENELVTFTDEKTQNFFFVWKV